MREVPLLGPKFSSHSEEDFYAYVKSIMQNTVSKEVSGIGIALGKKDKITIRMSREEKIVTREELGLLATEYKIDEMTLLKLFIKRKIGINYDNSPKRESDDAYIAAEKANARAAGKLLREKNRKDKLLKLERDSRLHEESPILAIDGVAEFNGV